MYIFRYLTLIMAVAGFMAVAPIASAQVGGVTVTTSSNAVMYEVSGSALVSPVTLQESTLAVGVNPHLFVGIGGDGVVFSPAPAAIRAINIAGGNIIGFDNGACSAEQIHGVAGSVQVFVCCDYEEFPKAINTVTAGTVDLAVSTTDVAIPGITQYHGSYVDCADFTATGNTAGLVMTNAIPQVYASFATGTAWRSPGANTSDTLGLYDLANAEDNMDVGFCNCLAIDGTFDGGVAVQGFWQHEAQAAFFDGTNVEVFVPGPS